MGRNLSPLHPPRTQLGPWGPLAIYTFSRSLAKSCPSFSWSKLAMNCWQDIFLPMFCNGEMVLPESRDGGWCGPHTLPCPARRDEAASRAVMKKDCLDFPLSPKSLQNSFSHSRFYLILKRHERSGFSSNPDEGVRLDDVL